MRVGQSPGEPLHVVHIAATADGAAWMHQMLCGLRARGYRTTAIIGGRGGTLEARLRRDDIPYHVLDLDPFAGRSAAAAAQKLVRLVRLLRRLEPDVVQYHLFQSIILGRLAGWAADVPVRFSMIPGTYYLEAPVLGDLDLRTVWADSKVIASCEYTRTLYTRGGVARDSDRADYDGQDANLFNPDQADSARVRAELGIAPGRPVVGDVAYFYPPMPDGPFTPPRLAGRGLKGHDVLLRAVPRVLERVPDALFVLVGEGWGPGGAEVREPVESTCPRFLGVAHAVLFAGGRADIPDTLMAFDVSVQCSLNENLGGSLESLLMRRPLVASDVGGLPDAVKHEQTGLLVPPGDPAALADAIARLLIDRPLALRLGTTGRQFALERFTLDRTVGELDALYRGELARVAGTGARRRRGYRPGLTVRRLAYLAPLSRSLLRMVKRAVRHHGTSHPRVVQMAGTTENGEWLVQICRRLRDRGHHVTAIIGWPERSLAQRLLAAGVPFGATELSFAPGRGRLRLLVYLGRAPLTVLRLARQFRVQRVTIVHTHIFNSMIIGRIAAWLARVPCRVSMVPGPIHLEAPFTRWADRLTWWMDHRVVAGCEATRAQDEALGMRAPRLQCIRYGVEAGRFDPSAKRRRATRSPGAAHRVRRAGDRPDCLFLFHHEPTGRHRRRFAGAASRGTRIFCPPCRWCGSAIPPPAFCSSVRAGAWRVNATASA